MNEYICKDFERTNQVHTLKDAICLTQEEWDTITTEELTAAQDQRWANWLAIVTAPSIEEVAPLDPGTE